MQHFDGKNWEQSYQGSKLKKHALEQQQKDESVVEGRDYHDGSDSKPNNTRRIQQEEKNKKLLTSSTHYSPTISLSSAKLVVQETGANCDDNTTVFGPGKDSGKPEAK